ncbi:MAG: CPBP family intramembrane metalloprotease [Deltaproteobacteria bacterium]|nr:CPBP family intramembrane metalloprotease [Deltaproteobacteria bacterium]
MVSLTIAKPLGNIAIWGTVAYTIVAAMQLYLPLWRADRLSVPLSFFGLSLARWRSDILLALLLCAITFPPYALLYHWFMTGAYSTALEVGLPGISKMLPHSVFAPHFPQELTAWFAATLWFLQVLATHTLGVALPEETFYRGYFEPRLASFWPAKRRFWGVALGRATVVTASLFALGHFLGEWNFWRLGPFFPAFLFSWLRGRSGTIVSAVAFHAACNTFGEVLFTLYRVN